MAKINDRYQLTNYGQEVQQAIDNALIYLPQELALKAYKDEVLLKNQTTPYTPTQNYHPATKLYVDTANSATNQRLDAETERAQAAEKVLNEKQVLTFDEKTTSYKYLNLVNIDRATQALVDENALDRKLAELAVGFFIFMLINPTTGDIIDGRDITGVSPYSIKKTLNDLPTNSIPANSIALTLNNSTTVNVYKYNSGWKLLKAVSIKNGWLFASTSEGKGYYWFVNTWNLIDMEVDMTQYYTKKETDDILKDYALNSTIGSLSSLSTTAKNTIVAAINEVRTLANNKDALPSIGAYTVLANNTNAAAKPAVGIAFSSTATNGSLAQRTTTGTLKAKPAVDADDLTTLDQVKTLVANGGQGVFQTVIPGGTAYDIVAYSGKAGELNTLTRATTINATLGSTSDTKIPTEKATATYVQNYKPVIITQGNANTSVTTSQLTFWIEQ